MAFLWCISFTVISLLNQKINKNKKQNMKLHKNLMIKLNLKIILYIFIVYPANICAFFFFIKFNQS